MFTAWQSIISPTAPISQHVSTVILQNSFSLLLLHEWPWNPDLTALQGTG